MWLPNLGMALTGYHLRLSPKVILPGFVGVTTVATNCELEKYGHALPWGILALGVVQVMILLGYMVKDPDRQGPEPNGGPKP